MIQPPQKKPTEKPESNLRGLRILILSLAVMTVGGGMMLFVYAFSKAHDSLNASAREECLNETLHVATEGNVQSLRTLRDNRLEVVIEHQDHWEVVELDRCSGERLSTQNVKPEGP